ncbi:MAG: fatty acid desaturase [bacterium]
MGSATRTGSKSVSARPEVIWDANRFKAFSQEIDSVRAEIEASLGEEDVRYVKKLRKVSRQMEALGRFLIFVSMDPVTWLVGVTALWVHRQIETTEIGHYALHGAWDRFPELSEFHSKHFKWESPAEEESWKHGHNGLHHQYTNIVGKDPDVNYGTLRTSEHTPWGLYHAIQVIQFFITAPFFMEVIGVYNTGLTDLLRKPKTPGYVDILPDRKLKTIARAAFQSLKKIVPFYGYHFVLWPVLAGPLWWKVLSGNFLAHVLNNVYTAASVYAGHFGEDTDFYPPDFKVKSRGEFYKAQVRAAHNFTSPLVFQILSGTLNAQIEHHLFPKFPPNRLRQIRSEVKEICDRYGAGYGEDTWWNTWKRAIGYLWKMSAKDKPAEATV